MPEARANNVTLTYEVSGPENGVPVIMIMGLAAQLIDWPPDMVKALNDAGYRTIRFDNRDIGLSEKMEGKKAPNIFLQAILQRFGIKGLAPYNLRDMAADTIGLLDALGIDKAHVIGVSMGGMIAQIVAGEFPDRVLSLTAIMTSTNEPRLPGARPDIARLMLRPGPPATSIDEAIEKSMRVWQLIKTQNGGWTDEALRKRISAAAHRSIYPAGPRRQTAAIVDSGDLRVWSKKVTAPTLVIHGDADPLVRRSGGLAVARAIKHSTHISIPNMGHDLPPQFLPRIAEDITCHLGGVMV